MRRTLRLLLALLLLLATLFGCAAPEAAQPDETPDAGVSALPEEISLSAIPDYSGAPYVVLADGIPRLDADDFTGSSFETYSELDELGRCGVAYACVGLDLMPTEERGAIGSVKPSGWHSVKYDVVEGKYLYNRCHLIGYQLSGENANPRNLITGTRYLNTQGMLPFENMVADYVKETENHVLYRVTPLFSGDELVARGVLMEAWSVEDAGEGICFCVYVYNVQPDVEIDYATGDSHLAATDGTQAVETYVLNTNTKKFHLPTCSAVAQIQEKNYQTYSGTREELLAQGYTPCANCQ